VKVIKKYLKVSLMIISLLFLFSFCDKENAAQQAFDSV
jgi:hypothetical protein